MIRDLPRLAEREFDVLVVGGGIYGLTIAYDAAQRGLSVALIERGDFGAATSFNHLKTIHGGLRYLQSADIRRMRESIRERRAFARIAPRLDRAAGVRDADRRVADAQSDGDEGGARASTRSSAAIATTASIPHVTFRRAASLRAPNAASCSTERFARSPSAAVWHDYQTVNGDRLTLCVCQGGRGARRRAGELHRGRSGCSEAGGGLPA